MFTKIDISKILKNHFATLYNANTKRPAVDDYVTFFVVPVLVSITLVCLDIYMSDSAINIVISSLSIFVGLLFNVIVLIFDLVKRDQTNNIKNIVIKQLISNIAYTIFISIISILLLLFTFIDNRITTIIFSSAAYFLLTNFLFTVLMILKRMFHLFHSEYDEITKK